MLRGLALDWTNGSSTIIESQFILDLGARTWLGIPEATYIMLALFAVVGFVLRFTRLGSNFLAAGSNPIATRRAGIAVWRTLTTVYLFSGVSAAFAGSDAHRLPGRVDPVRGRRASSSRCSVRSFSVAPAS